jgi:hypothetical protein
MKNQTKDGQYFCVFGCGWRGVSKASRKTHNKKCDKNIHRAANQEVTRKNSENKEHKRFNQKNYRTLDPDTFSEIYDDLPDGAFFAMAEEHGLHPEDFIR